MFNGSGMKVRERVGEAADAFHYPPSYTCDQVGHLNRVRSQRVRVVHAWM